MSLLCNLGRPPQDAGLQNLVVNDTLRVNKLLKSAKAEVNRLCADVSNPSVTLTGSAVYDSRPGAGFVFFCLPSGNSPSIGSAENGVPSVFTTFWTDNELIIDDFRAAVTGAGSDVETPYTLNVRVVAAPTLSELNNFIPNDTQRVTITLPNVSLNPQTIVSASVPVTIPAGSYVGMRFDSAQSVTDMNLTWSLRVQNLN